MTTYDVLFMHNQFVLVTTVTMQPALDKRDIEKVALDKLQDEYGSTFAEIVASSKQVTIEEVPGTSVPTPGDLQDAGVEDSE